MSKGYWIASGQFLGIVKPLGNTRIILNADKCWKMPHALGVMKNLETEAVSQ
jgi:hypothetical protein